MFRPIVHSNLPVTLVGGGQGTRRDLHKSLRIAPLCVAADGGARLALAAGVEIEALIGDFDSVGDAVLREIPRARQHHISEQDSTDFEKALSRIDAPLVLGVGFLGGRVDHQLAVLQVLLRYPARPCLLLGAQEVICLAPPQIAVDMRAGETLSLFPLAPVTGRSSGLEWPIEGIGFAPDGRGGTSNRATGPVTLDFDCPGMLLIAPRRLMRDVAQRLAAPDAARWPARKG